MKRSRFPSVSSRRRHDHQLADDVRAAQVDARIGFGIACLLSHAYGAAERNFGAHAVEDVVERPRNHRLDAQDAVAAVYQVGDRVDDRQTGADVGLEEEFRVAFARDGFELAVEGVVGRRGDLVGGHHRDVVVEQRTVERRHLRAGRAVDEDRVVDVQGEDFVAQALRRRGRSLLFEPPEAVVQDDAFGVDEPFAGVGDSHDADLESVVGHERAPLQADLFQQVAPHLSDASHEDVEYLILRQEERVVDHVDRLRKAFERHDHRDVGLRGALRAGDDVDAVASQRPEQLARDAGRMFHVVAHHGDRRQVVFGGDAAHLADLDFGGELPGEHRDGQIGVLVAQSDRRGVLRGGLRHEEDADAGPGQCAEDAVVDADHAYHAKPLNGHQTGVVDRGDSLDRLVAPLHPLAGDERARRFGVEGVLDQDGDVAVVDREDRGRIDHLRAEVAQLHRLFEAQPVDDIGIADDARVGRHETVDVGPDFERLGVQRGGDECGGVVRSAAPQIGHVARGAVRGDEARHYRHAGAVGQTLPDELFGQIRFGDVLSEVGLRADELPRVVEPRAFEHGGHDSRREAFAVADDRVARAGREVADQVDAAQDIGQFVEQFVRPPADRAAPLGRHRFVDRRAVAGHDFGQRVGVVGLSGRGCGRRGQQTVGDAAQRRNDHDDLAVVGGDDPAHLSQTLCGTYRRSAEF